VPGPAWAAAILFGPVGVFAFWVGVLDVLWAAPRYKLIRLAFAVAGLILLAASVSLLWEPWRRKRGRIASIAAGVAGLRDYSGPGLRVMSG